MMTYFYFCVALSLLTLTFAWFIAGDRKNK